MPEIGTTLREARMRQRIDISEIESETKIRAKYLRALENEEWDLLPGPTYVKSFLRTYAEALGLDGKLLVEEYKLRHERLSDVELQPIAPLPPDARQRLGPAARQRPAAHRAGRRQRHRLRDQLPRPPDADAGAAAEVRRVSARAGIVVTGTEVLTGRVADRNGPWVSDRLREQGVDLA